jgi:pimeloyl-ACP methyl ester carboxylesterase
VQKVYRFLDAEQKVGLSLRAGEHATTAEDIEQYVDFFDSVFGRSSRPVPRTTLFAELPAIESAAAPPKTAAVPDRMRWLLGEKPPALPFPVRNTLEGRTLTDSGWLAMLYGRPLKRKGFSSVSVPFGDDLRGELYLPDPRPSGKMPVVIWLHPYAYATGYSRDAAPLLQRLTGMGYAVFAFDQIGFGSRIHQATRFYQRYPEWSLLGKMVDDTSAAVAAMAAMQELDSSRVWLAGYSLGGKVALWTAALDTRVAGVIASGAFTPLRTPRADTEGIDEYTTLHGLLPRLRAFREKPAAIPVDYDEILKAIAPRPVYVRAPSLDRFASAADVKSAMNAAGRHVTLVTPLDFNRFRTEAQREAFEWLARQN